MRDNQQRLNPAALVAASLSLLALFLISPAGARAQWTQPDAGGNINNTNPGNVKVGGGAAAPTSVLHTKGNLSSQLTGTVAVTQNSVTVTGAGTAFTTELAVGDSLKIGTSTFTVSAIPSATSLTLDSNYTGATASGLPAFRDPGLFAVDNGAGVSKLALDRMGRLGIGTASPSARLSVVETVTTPNRGVAISQYSNDTTAALLTMTKFRGTPAAPATIVNGDTLASINANAYIGTYVAPGGISFVSNGAISAGTVPMDIVLRAGSTAAGVERMRVTSGGFVGIGNPSPSFTLDVAGQVRSSSGGFVFPDGTTQATALSFGATAGKAVQGNTTLTVAAGAGMSGGGTATLGGGGTLTLTNSDRGSTQNMFKGVGNAAGATQFSAGSNSDTLRFEGTGGTTVSFDAANRKVVINSASSSTSGWTDGGASVSLTNSAAKVGIGTTTTPSTAKLVIAGSAGTPGIDLASSDVYAEMRVIRNSVGATDKDLFLQFGAGASSKTHIYSSNAETVTVTGGKVGVGNTNPAVALDVAGAINATGAITGATVNATYQDVAEWVPSSQKLAAGTVVVLDKSETNHVLASTRAYDTKVAGVVSAEPGVILGVGGDGKLKVATTGRVRVKVDATRSPIEVGDLLVTGEAEGVAMKSVELDLGGVKLHRPGTIIGKALEPLASGTGEILVLLSLQ